VKTQGMSPRLGNSHRVGGGRQERGFAAERERETERERKGGRDGNSWRYGLDAEGATQSVRGGGASVRDRVSILILRVRGGGGFQPSLPHPLCINISQI